MIDEEEEILQAKTETDAPPARANAQSEERAVAAKAEPAAAPPDDRREAPAKPAPSVAPRLFRRGLSLFPSDVAQHGGRGPPVGPSAFETQLNSSKGAGRELPPDTRVFMEGRFKSDFRAVRIHTGPTAERLSGAIHARAFAHGGDVFFNRGQFDPDSAQGKTLLAHELTHTIQQGASPALSAGKPTPLADQPAAAPTSASVSTTSAARPATASVLTARAAAPSSAAAPPEQKLRRSLEQETEEREVEEEDLAAFGASEASAGVGRIHDGTIGRGRNARCGRGGARRRRCAEGSRAGA